MDAGLLKGSGSMSSIWCRRSPCWPATNTTLRGRRPASPGGFAPGLVAFWWTASGICALVLLDSKWYFPRMGAGPDPDLIASITPDVMRCLDDSGFFEKLDDALCPKDESHTAESCSGNYELSE